VNANIVALVLGEMAFVAFVLWLAVAFIRDLARHRAELQRGVVDRFSSAPEFLAFLETGPGRRFQASLTGRPLLPLTRVLGGTVTGIVLVALGVGLVVAWLALGDRDLAIAGAVAVSLGIGFLVAAAVSHRLCVRWGLVPGERSEERAPVARS